MYKSQNLFDPLLIFRFSSIGNKTHELIFPDTLNRRPKKQLLRQKLDGVYNEHLSTRQQRSNSKMS